MNEKKQTPKIQELKKEELIKVSGGKKYVLCIIDGKPTLILVN